MLSYQHNYHAGNFADVIKHIILIEVLNYIKLKDNPLCYIDTHAGRGLYQLSDKTALQTKEFLSGIAKVWQLDDLPENVKDYIDIVELYNTNRLLNQYPGSPLIAAQLLRKQDRLVCHELHPKEFSCLANVVKNDKRIKVLKSDGFKSCLGLLPPPERRGLVLFDPSYELKTDYRTVVHTLQALYKKFSTGCYLIWYPVVARERNLKFERALCASGIPNIQLYELGIKPDNTDFGMTASGMIAVNPPWVLRARMEQTLPWLVDVLAENKEGHFRIEQLVPEK